MELEKIKVNKNMKFDISLSPSNMEQTNPQFLRTKIKVFYEGVNRNNSHFTKDVINRAQYSAYNIPIVGEFNSEKNNFGGHGGRIEITDEDVKLVQTTVPYGVVPMDAKFSWEPVTEKNGEVRDYYTIDGALLWTGRYPELNTILEEGAMGQSAEIEVQSGDFAIVDGQETFKINEFIFSALCILGISKESDPYGHTEPCFESANIEVSQYELQESKFKESFNFMMRQLSNTDDTTSEETKQDENGGQQVMSKDTNLNFELTHQQLSAKLRQSLQVHRFVDKEGQSARRYWYQDHTNTKVIYEDLSEAGQLYESPFRVNGNEVTIDLADRVQASLAFIPDRRNDYNLTEELEKAQAKVAEFEATLTAKETEVEETVESLKAKHAEEIGAIKTEYTEVVEGLKSDLSKLASKSEEFDAVQAEVVELRGFKRGAELAEIKAKFSGKLEEKSLDTILEASADKSVAELESQIFAEIGKQNFSLTQDVQVTKPSVQFSQRTVAKNDGYNGLFQQFGSQE